MTYYPVLLDLKGATALVVGGGNVAQRKVDNLLECGAYVNIVSRDLTPGLRHMIDTGKVRFLGQDFEERHLSAAFLVIAATDDKALNHRISEAARHAGKLINAVDQPSECNFIIPSVVRRDDLVLAISTSGKSPALAQRLRKGLEAQFGPEYGTFLKAMGGLRHRILQRGFPSEQNSEIFHRLIDGSVLEAVDRGDWAHVRKRWKEVLPKDLAWDDVLP